MQLSAAFIISLIPLVLALPAVMPRQEGIFEEILEPIEDIPVVGEIAEVAAVMIDTKYAPEEKIVEPFVEPLIKPTEEAIGKEVKKIEDEMKHAIGHKFEKELEHEVKKGVENKVGKGLENEIGNGLEKEVEGGHSSGGFHFGSLFGGH